MCGASSRSLQWLSLGFLHCQEAFDIEPAPSYPPPCPSPAWSDADAQFTHTSTRPLRYFLKRLKRVKKANGEIVSISTISEKRPTRIKNFGILCVPPPPPSTLWLAWPAYACDNSKDVRCFVKIICGAYQMVRGILVAMGMFDLKFEEAVLNIMICNLTCVLVCFFLPCLQPAVRFSLGDAQHVP